MKKLFYFLLFTLTMGCQSESLDIRANYRIKLDAAHPTALIQAHQRYDILLYLTTDSYYSEDGYQLQFYQQSGLGRLDRNRKDETTPVLQKVNVPLPLGESRWYYTPEAAGTSQAVFIAQQEQGYTKPDTLRITFQVEP